MLRLQDNASNGKFLHMSPFFVELWESSCLLAPSTISNRFSTPVPIFWRHSKVCKPNIKDSLSSIWVYLQHHQSTRHHLYLHINIQLYFTILRSNSPKISPPENGNPRLHQPPSEIQWPKSPPQTPPNQRFPHFTHTDSYTKWQTSRSFMTSKPRLFHCLLGNKSPWHVSKGCLTFFVPGFRG